MGKGTKYTSKKQASQSSGAAKAWKYFERLYMANTIISIQFDFGCQEWICKTIHDTSYASKAEMDNFK